MTESQIGDRLWQILKRLDEMDRKLQPCIQSVAAMDKRIMTMDKRLYEQVRQSEVHTRKKVNELKDEVTALRQSVKHANLAILQLLTDNVDVSEFDKRAQVNDHIRANMGVDDDHHH